VFSFSLAYLKLFVNSRKGNRRSLLSVNGKGVSKALNTERNSDRIQRTGDTIIDLNKTNAKYHGKSDAKMFLVLKSVD